MTNIDIRLAGPDDADAVARTVDAMNDYYGDMAAPPGGTAVAARRWLTDPDASDARFALAFADGAPVGMAVFALLHPGRSLEGLMFLKDLFVLEEHRSTGAGEALMRFLAQYCIDRGVGRIDWTTESDRAEAFYARLGATSQRQKRFMRFDGGRLKALAKGMS